MGFNFKSFFFLTRKVLQILVITTLFACARAPVKEADRALRPSPAPILYDDIQDLQVDLKQYLDSLAKSFLDNKFHYQDKAWSGKEIYESYHELLSFIRSYPTEKQIQKYIEDHFQFYQVYGAKRWGDVFVTSYFEPLYEGSLNKNSRFQSAALKRPEDLVQVNLKEFAHTHEQLSPHLDYILKNDKGPRSLTGRLEDKKVLPYYSRKEIIQNKKLHKKEQVILWLDPIDLFFLQIQGSGTIKLDNGKEVTLGYAAQNGHDYVAIGKFLTDFIPLKEMTAGKIEDYLRSLAEDERQKLMNQNPSYVFFEKKKGRPITSMGNEVINGRTIATDSFYFEKGMMGYLEVPHPEGNGEIIRRFVFNQDSGGAIKGPGRVDLFWGRGKEAGRIAGKMKHRGRLWFLLPRKETGKSL